MNLMSKSELVEAGDEMTGGNVKDMSIDQLQRLMTVTQHVTNLCLAEIENRGELHYHDGYVIVPYQCDYNVETILTRP